MTRVFDVRLQAALLAVACAGMISMFCGCAGGAGRKGGAAALESLHVLSVPVAVDFDGVPGPDGFALTLFAKGSKSAKGAPLPAGVLELLMYDGLYADGMSPAPELLRAWRFTEAEWRKHSGRSAVGTGYRFTLRWEEARPTRSQITIVARFTPDRGPAVKSAPSSVAVGTK